MAQPFSQIVSDARNQVSTTNLPDIAPGISAEKALVQSRVANILALLPDGNEKITFESEASSAGYNVLLRPTTAPNEVGADLTQIRSELAVQMNQQKLAQISSSVDILVSKYQNFILTDEVLILIVAGLRREIISKRTNIPAIPAGIGPNNGSIITTSDVTIQGRKQGPQASQQRQQIEIVLDNGTVIPAQSVGNSGRFSARLLNQADGQVRYHVRAINPDTGIYVESHPIDFMIRLPVAPGVPGVPGAPTITENNPIVVGSSGRITGSLDGDNQTVELQDSTGATTHVGAMDIRRNGRDFIIPISSALSGGLGIGIHQCRLHITGPGMTPLDRTITLTIDDLPNPNAPTITRNDSIVVGTGGNIEGELAGDNQEVELQNANGTTIHVAAANVGRNGRNFTIPISPALSTSLTPGIHQCRLHITGPGMTPLNRTITLTITARPNPVAPTINPIDPIVQNTTGTISGTISPGTTDIRLLNTNGTNVGGVTTRITGNTFTIRLSNTATIGPRQYMIRSIGSGGTQTDTRVAVEIVAPSNPNAPTVDIINPITYGTEGLITGDLGAGNRTVELVDNALVPVPGASSSVDNAGKFTVTVPNTIAVGKRRYFLRIGGHGINGYDHPIEITVNQLLSPKAPQITEIISPTTGNTGIIRGKLENTTQQIELYDNAGAPIPGTQCVPDAEGKFTMILPNWLPHGTKLRYFLYVTGPNINPWYFPTEITNHTPQIRHQQPQYGPENRANNPPIYSPANMPYGAPKPSIRVLNATPGSVIKIFEGDTLIGTAPVRNTALNTNPIPQVVELSHLNTKREGVVELRLEYSSPLDPPNTPTTPFLLTVNIRPNPLISRYPTNRRLDPDVFLPIITGPRPRGGRRYTIEGDIPGRSYECGRRGIWRYAKVPIIPGRRNWRGATEITIRSRDNENLMRKIQQYLDRVNDANRYQLELAESGELFRDRIRKPKGQKPGNEGPDGGEEEGSEHPAENANRTTTGNTDEGGDGDGSHGEGGNGKKGHGEPKSLFQKIFYGIGDGLAWVSGKIPKPVKKVAKDVGVAALVGAGTYGGTAIVGGLMYYFNIAGYLTTVGTVGPYLGLGMGAYWLVRRLLKKEKGEGEEKKEGGHGHGAH